MDTALDYFWIIYSLVFVVSFVVISYRDDDLRDFPIVAYFINGFSAAIVSFIISVFIALILSFPLLAVLVVIMGVVTLMAKRSNLRS